MKARVARLASLGELMITWDVSDHTRGIWHIREWYEDEQGKRQARFVPITQEDQECFLRYQGDLAVCLAEIEREREEKARLRREVARIVLRAEENPTTDGTTITLKFTKDLLDQLRSYAA